MQSEKQADIIQLDKKLKKEKIQIFGLYDPGDFGLDINMWSNSDGDQLKSIFSKLNKVNLSVDASEIMKISILTNAHAFYIKVCGFHTHHQTLILIKWLKNF